MTSFRDREFSSRFAQMGDKAEAAFDAAFPAHHKLGLNRPPMQVGRLAPLLRYTPDRLTTDGFIEVQGMGRDQTVKLKVEKMLELMRWSVSAPLQLFLYDSHKKRWCIGTIDEWVDVFFQFGEYAQFPEGKPYIGVHARDIPFAWIKEELGQQ
jgi:hypothetical protein